MNVRIETNNFHGTTLSSTDDVYNSRRFLNVAHFSHAFMRQNERNSTPSSLRLSSRGLEYSIFFHHFAHDFHESSIESRLDACRNALLFRDNDSFHPPRGLKRSQKFMRLLRYFHVARIIFHSLVSFFFWMYKLTKLKNY